MVLFHFATVVKHGESYQLYFIFFNMALCTASDENESFEMLIDPTRRRLKQYEHNLDQSFFPSLENYQVNAMAVTEEEYPWIARVVHSRSADVPHACTAVCIDEGIFITAARCIFSLVVHYTSVIYLKQHLPAIAFVLPSNTTKQLYDDIGFIIVDRANFKEPWPVIELFGNVNRTAHTFRWFSKLEKSLGTDNYKVVGYATMKGIHRIKAVQRRYDLTELNVVVGMDICSKILTFHGRIDGFVVPCYHSCTVEEFLKTDKKCSGYHGVEGGAVFDTMTNRLMGVATWGAYSLKYELPVGFSVANSVNFFKDYSCAKRIRDDNRHVAAEGYYQRLCDKV